MWNGKRGGLFCMRGKEKLVKMVVVDLGFNRIVLLGGFVRW